MTKKERGDIRLAQEKMQWYTNQMEKFNGMLGYPSHIPELDKYTSGLIPGKVYTIAGYSNTGKAQPLWSEVLTPDGYKTMGNIEIGDYVIGEDGKIKMVLGIPYQGEQNIYKITMKDGRVVFAGEHHEFRVRYSERYHSREHSCNKYRYVSKDIEVVDMIGEKNYHGGNKYIIDCPSPIEMEEKQFPIDPYLLGVILGDGYTRRHVSITSGDKDIINNCILPKGDRWSITSKKGNCFSYNICGEKLDKISIVSQEIINIGLGGTKSRTKFIPEEYLLGSIEQRTRLLQGLMDTDGTVCKNGKKTRYEFDTISEELGNGLYNLVLSLGGKIIKCNKMSKLYGKECGMSYRYYFILPKHIKGFLLERKMSKLLDNDPHLYASIKSIEPYGKEETKCITVEGGLYITDNYIVTHNSRFSYEYVNHMLSIGKKVIFWSLEVDKGLLFQHLCCNKYNCYPKELTDEMIDIMDFSNLLIYDDTYNLADIEQFIMQEKPDMCVIDFVQNIQVTGVGGYEAMAIVARKIQEVAIKSNTIMVSLSQISNDTAKELSKGNTSFITLKGAGEFIASSDVVILLHMMDGELIVTIAKTKFAQKPEDPLVFKPDFGRSKFTYSRHA